MSYYQKLTERFQQIYRLDHAITYLNWDQMVMMPANGNDARAQAIAELASVRHGFLTAPEVSDWFDEIESSGEVQQVSQKAMLREMRRKWREAHCLPSALVKARVVAGSRCEHGWRQQRPNNDWTGFLANFKAVVDLSREEANHRLEVSDGRLASPYEALLDLYCTGDSLSLVESVFTVLRQELPQLLQQAQDQQASSQQTVTGDFPIAEQHAINEKLMQCLGFDFESGRLDQSIHPFSTGVAGDLRITTRYRTTDFLEALNATAHETGHASYEGGLASGHESVLSMRRVIRDLCSRLPFARRNVYFVFTQPFCRLRRNLAKFCCTGFWSVAVLVDQYDPWRGYITLDTVYQRAYGLPI